MASLDTLLVESSLRAPMTRPVSREQLMEEVHGPYVDLVMVEPNWIDVDLKQARLAEGIHEQISPRLTDEQWQALIALHRMLLHEHHEFFLACQHPAASPAL